MAFEPVALAITVSLPVASPLQPVPSVCPAPVNRLYVPPVFGVTLILTLLMV